MLQIENLRTVYPDGTAGVTGVDITAADGESVALIGANGAGKTTLLLSLVGILPCEGRVAVDGVTLGKKTLREVRRRIGMVFQNPDDQLFMPSVYEDAAFGLRGGDLSEAEIEERVDGCLAALGVPQLKTRTALRLSGGEKRMAALATVLVMQPSVMLLDEPTAFLDPKARRALIRTLAGLPHAKLIATHDLTFAAETCPRCVLLKDGRVFASGRSDELLYDAALMDACGVEAIGTWEGRGAR